jgi:tape measure domain-containing protein
VALSAGNIYVGVKGDLNPLDKALKAARSHSETASKKIKGAFEKIERSAKRTAKAITTGLGGAISGLAVGTLVTQAIKLADTYTLLESRIGLVVDSSEELIRTQEDLFAISQESRVGYETTVEIFTRLSRATKDVGLSQEDMLKVTENLNKAVTVSGATTTEASNALIQLSQGLAANRLGGEELRSVMEQIPRVARMIADGLGVDIGQFREMSKQGKLTAEVVTKALLSQSEAINNEFGQIPVTVGGAWTMIENSIGRAVDIINESTGATENLAKMMVWFSEVIDENTDKMARFIDLTVSGLLTIAKIAAVGGALWALPIVITKAHEAFVLMQLTMFKVQAGVIGLNTALFGTSVSAQLAAGSLSKMKLAGLGLFALFAGWELGKWANENFEEVRLAGLAAIAGLDNAWIGLKFSSEKVWLDIKFAAIRASEDIRDKVASVFEKIAESMSGLSVTIKNPFGDDFQVGLDSAASKFDDLSEKIKGSSTAAGDHETATNKLKGEMEKAYAVHDRTVEILIGQREWTKKVTESDEDAAESAEDKAWRTAAANIVITESTEDMSDMVTQAHLQMYEDLGGYGEDYQELLFDQLDAQYEKYEEIGVDSLLLDQWYYGERKKLLDQFTGDVVTAQGAISEAVTQSAHDGALAWMTGENAKIAASDTAKRILVENALKAAQEPLKKGLLNLLGEQLGAWIGLGTGQSQVEGETWQERLGNGAKYLAQAAALIIAGKAIGSATFADGGWLGNHPSGGMINQGSGTKDDVFLGFTGGGTVANYGMGGEYVIPRKQTQKYFGALEAIRSDNFAEGGPVGDPEELAHNINAGGFATFFQEWRKTGNYKQGIKSAVIYYLSTAMAMEAGKSWGGAILGLANGGVVGRGFAEGGPVVDQYSGEGFDLNVTKQIKEWMGSLGDIADPLGITESVESLMNMMNEWINVDALTVSGGEYGLYKGAWDIEIPEWLDRGMITTSRDTVDRMLIPFATDILTPGGGHDIPEGLRYTFTDALEESVEQGFKGLVGLSLEDDWKDVAKKIWDPLDLFHTGTSFVPSTGPALIERGERIFSAPENREIMEMLRGGGDGGINLSVTPHIVVKIGEEDFTDRVEIISENVIIERENRGLSTGTGARVRT